MTDAERIERLRAALEEVVREASDLANEVGCPGFLGARLHDARRVLAETAPTAGDNWHREHCPSDCDMDHGPAFRSRPGNIEPETPERSRAGNTNHGLYDDETSGDL